MSRIRVRVRTATVDDVDALLVLLGDLGPVRGRVPARLGPDGFRMLCPSTAGACAAEPRTSAAAMRTARMVVMEVS